jgi:hypothetical protein
MSQYGEMDISTKRIGWLNKRGLFYIWFSRYVALKVTNGVPVIHYYDSEDQVLLIKSSVAFNF